MNRFTTFSRLFREQGNRRAVKLMSKRQWKFPAAKEHQYARMVREFLNKAWEGYANAWLATYIPARSDALEDILPEDPTRSPVFGAIVTLAEDIDKFNKQEWDAFKKIAVGAAFSEDDPWVGPILDEWARTQVTLITKASQDMQGAVSRRVRKGVSEGRGLDEVKTLIMRDLPGISTRRAAIIARDQVAKLNSDLSHGRMEQAGIETYIWSTSMDERVRGLPGGKYADSAVSHYIMECKVCRWDDPTKYRNAQGQWVSRPIGAPTLHPGQDIMCRCVALPNWDELDELTDATPEERAQTELEAAQDALARATTAASYIDPSNPAYKEFEKMTTEAQKFLDSLKNTQANTGKQPGAAAAAAVVKRVLQMEHPTRVSGAQTSSDFLMSQLGIDAATAKRYSTAIEKYSGQFYTHIRNYQKGRKMDVSASTLNTYKRWGEDLEQFIDISPKWGGGTTYRGFSTSSERFEGLLNDLAGGKELDMGGTSSWSTNKGIAEKFSKFNLESDKMRVVLECKGPNRGTSIRAVSEVTREDEVLVSRLARYKIIGTRQESNAMIFEVEEVSNGW